MGIEDRKQREREQMRSLILEAAKKLFIEKGVEQTSMRAIAEAIEYSPATIYLYYKDKNALIHDLHVEGFTRMNHYMAALLHVKNPMEKLSAMGRAYVQFSLENPDYYELMFITQKPIEGLEKPENWKEGALTFDALVNVVNECQSEGRFPGKDPIRLSFLIWSCVHGICALKCCRRIDIIQDIPHDQLIADALKYFIDFLERL
ncbi:MAG: TetR/AcrR family transcriptional regulator [Bacteroidia bacterium]